MKHLMIAALAVTALTTFSFGTGAMAAPAGSLDNNGVTPLDIIANPANVIDKAPLDKIDIDKATQAEIARDDGHLLWLDIARGTDEHLTAPAGSGFGSTHLLFHEPLSAAARQIGDEARGLNVDKAAGGDGAIYVSTGHGSFESYAAGTIVHNSSWGFDESSPA